MPQTIPAILDRTDEPRPGDERAVDEYLLQRAAPAQARRERQIIEAVGAGRRAGVSQGRIGKVLGASAQAAQQRYGPVAQRA